jgi:DNA-binding SARP family transcriptional activator
METVFPEIRACLLGSFKLFEGGCARPLPASSHARTLLAYLLLNRKKTHPRLVVANLLSPEASEANARHLLNQTLWHIRKSLPGLLICDPNEITISPTYPLVVDVSEFEGRIHTYLTGKRRSQDVLRELDHAIELYQGDLLDEFFDDWVLLERERVRELYFQALEYLIQAHKAAREYQQALNVALRLLQSDPLRESNQREVMRLHHLLGHGGAALKHYQEFQRLLLDELGMEPEPETVELMREIARRSSLQQLPYLPEATVPTGRSLLENSIPGELPLIGRLAEKKAILARLEPVFLQRGAILLLEGEPGVGKTHLLREVQRDLEWRGAQVIWSKVSQLKSAPVSDALPQALKAGLSPLRIEQIRSLARPEQSVLLEETLADILTLKVRSPSAEPVSARDQRQVIVQGLACVLSLWSQVTPLVIVLEDLHWASQDAWEMLGELVRYLYEREPVGVGIILSIRPQEALSQPWICTALSTMSETELLNHLELRPLDRERTGELVRACLGLQQALEPIETILYRETGGNPLFTLESLRWLYTQGQLVRGVDGGWQMNPDVKPVGRHGHAIPPMVEGILARRIEQLPSQTVQVLQVLAVLGDTLDFASLQATCAMEPADLLAALRQLVQAHFLVETAQDYHFSHDLLRQASYDSIPEEEKEQLHARVGSILESIHPELTDALAYHFDAGRLNDRAVQSHEKAGKAARQVFAYHQAAHHFQRAIDGAVRAGLAPARCFELYYEHESILDILGERDAQQRDLQALERLVDQHKLGNGYRLRVQFRWANLLYLLGEYPQSEAIARQALSLAEREQNQRAMAQAMLAIGSALHGAGHDDQAIPHLQAAIPRLQALNERQAEVKAWQTLAIIHADASRYVPAMQAIEASTVLNRQLDDRPALTRDLVLTGWILLEQGEFDRVEPCCQEALRISLSLGDRIDEAFALDILANLEIERGCAGQSLELFDRALEICRSLKEEKLRTSILLERANLMILSLGDFKQAARSLREAEALAHKHRLTRDLAILAGIWARIDLYNGDLRTARSKLQRAILQIQGQCCPSAEITLRRVQVELELAAGEPVAALHFLEEAEKHSQNIIPGFIQCDLLADQSAVLLACGRPAEALLASSRAMSCRSPIWNRHCTVPYCHYQALTACGRTDEAYQALAMAAQEVEGLIASLPPHLQRTARECVPVHQEILLAWESLQPQQVRLALPHSAAEAGDSSPASQEILVSWTVWLPEDEAFQGKVERRRHQLKRLLEEARDQGASPAYKHLAQALGVSVRTIAEDMAALREPDSSPLKK